MATASWGTCRAHDEMRPSTIWRPSAILNTNFVILDHSRSQPCGPITVSKFGVDPIFPAGDITIWYYSLAGKRLTTPPFWVFLVVLNPLILWVVIPTPKRHIVEVFLPDFMFFYHSGTVIQVSSKVWMFLISTPHKTRTFTVRLAIATNTKETVLQQKCCLDATTQESSQSVPS